MGSLQGRGGRIRPEDVAAVKERTRIDDVIRAAGIELRPAGGGNLKGLCPFHDEQTASFHVQPARGKYHCFGCDEGGDVFDFVAAIDHVSFAQAVISLGDQAGIQIQVEGANSQDHARWTAERERRLALRVANTAAAALFAAELRSPEALAARKYLSERAFTAVDLEPFQVGYSPRDNALVAALRPEFSDDVLVAANLAVRLRDGRLVDRFAGRVMFPIRDASGVPIGFGARRLYDDDRFDAKYLNTSETLLYNKSQALYGLDLAKRSILHRRQVNIVEGYTDVIAAHLAEVPNTVASCGTAFGDGHVQMVRRLLVDEEQSPGRVVFAYDSDAAGLKAAQKAFDTQDQFAGMLFVATGADGRDPCDLRAQEGPPALRQLLEYPRPLVELVLKAVVARHDPATAEGRAAASAAAVKVLSKITSLALRQDYTRQAAGWIGLPSPELLVVAPEPRRAPPHPTQHAPKDSGTEWEAVKLAAQHPEVFERALAAAGGDSGSFTNPVYRRLWHLIGQHGWVGAVELARAGDDDVRRVAARAEVEPILALLEDSAAVEAFAGAVVEQLVAPSQEGKLSRLRAALAAVDPDDVAGAAAMMQSIEEIEASGHPTRGV